MPLQLRKLIPYALAGWFPGGRKHCVMCGHKVWRFMPYRHGIRGVAPLMLAMNVIGSDVEHFECPRCGAHDRERHLLLYLRASGLLNWLQGKSILHFAPERHLPRHLQAAAPARYVQADLFPSRPDILRVDMLAMDFADAEFDLLVANHVLEHVDALDRALSEIHRVLKPGGMAILQVPFSPMLQHTWEDAGITSSSARLQAYGQEDHVRLFGRDVPERIKSAGLSPRISQHHELLHDINALAYGVNADEPFFLFTKNGYIPALNESAGSRTS